MVKINKMELINRIITNSPEETEGYAYEFAKMLTLGDFVAMRGDLGAGKTAFVRGAARLLTPYARIQSPTYTIVNEYPGKVPLYHFDMYRIDGEESLYSMGFFDYIDKNGICIAEWSEKIEDYIPENSYFVTIEKYNTADNKRVITVERRTH